MSKIRKIEITKGSYWIKIPEAEIFILCGCPADIVKHLLKRGLIVKTEKNGVTFETGPNVILLSDVLIQNGQFSNLAEFPVMQMLYRQGMILPGHPNNTGIKPLIIGSKDQVEAQKEYIYRGNYGLVSKEEIIEAGISPEEAELMMKLKLKFAFGKIQKTEELLDIRIIENEYVKIRNGVRIKRLELNVFQIFYKNESVMVDLNLSNDENYETPYPPGFHNIKREYFAVIHSGEGDGWDYNRPSMSSILLYQGRIYLIDAGPHLLDNLIALGIGINEIEGIFHTHSHDDHFVDLTTLIRTDHKIKYYSTPLVRESITKKLRKLVSKDNLSFSNYFDVHDLNFNEWNNIEGLEVKPLFSPHPVETNIFIFRTFWGNRHWTYAHYADIVSLKVLKGMICKEDSGACISKEYYDQIKNGYLIPADIKKLDIGGGLIHGDAMDFKKDKSSKIILAHTSHELNDRQKEIGSEAPFGTVDVLIPAFQDYNWRYAHQFLKSYFPDVPLYNLRMLLNNKVVTYNPRTILLKNGVINENLFLILAGNVEMIQSDQGVNNMLSAGALIGDMSGLSNTPVTETYRAVNFSKVLQIPVKQYFEFVRNNGLFNEITRLQSNKEFLNKIWLFGESISYPVQNRIALAMKYFDFPEGHLFSDEILSGINIIKKGGVKRYAGRETYELIGPGSFFGEENVISGIFCAFNYRTVKKTELFYIPETELLNIPVIRWKLLEAYKKRMKMLIDTVRKDKSD